MKDSRRLRSANLHTAVITILSLTAFALNSIVCRVALGSHLIDASSFTAIRLLSAAAVLTLAMLVFRKGNLLGGGSWISAVFISVYAITFSYAYSMISTGTGALILFGSVQVTMIAVGIRSGERLHVFDWFGLLAALIGLLYLVSPGLMAPSVKAAALMAVAGAAWGFYSLRGAYEVDPISGTAGNLIRAVPFALVFGVLLPSSSTTSVRGALLAIFSGAISTGVGYIIWYAALKGLTATRAAMVQLAVPLLAAIGGIILLAEKLSLRLVISALMILGGVGLAIVLRKQNRNSPETES